MLILSEQLLTLSAAARAIPGRSGQGVHAATTWRWVRRGVRGIRLETVLIGGIRYTSREALERFFAAITAIANGETPPIRTPTQRQRQIEAAERELSRAGI